jgi:hypothetical protein
VLGGDGSISWTIGPEVHHAKTKRTNEFVPLEEDRLLVACLAAPLHFLIRKLWRVGENVFLVVRAGHAFSLEIVL